MHRHEKAWPGMCVGIDGAEERNWQYERHDAQSVEVSHIVRVQSAMGPQFGTVPSRVSKRFPLSQLRSASRAAIGVVG